MVVNLNDRFNRHLSQGLMVTSDLDDLFEILVSGLMPAIALSGTPANRLTGNRGRALTSHDEIDIVRQNWRSGARWR